MNDADNRPAVVGQVERPVRPLEVGQRVRHNYKSGHGFGKVLERRGDGCERLAYIVLWDKTGNAMPYTHNTDNQEIVAA